jgi:hypothetical protein
VPLAHRERLRGLDETARAFGVLFNIHQVFPQPAETTPEGDGYDIFIGFPLIALTFVNRPAVGSADGRAGLGQMWEAVY